MVKVACVAGRGMGGKPQTVGGVPTEEEYSIEGPGAKSTRQAVLQNPRGPARPREC